MHRNSHLTKRLAIRPLKDSNYLAWFEAYSNSFPKKSKYDKDPYPANQCSIKRFKFLLKKYERMAKKDSTYVWGVFERRTGALIGILDISIINRDPLQVANLGYRVFNKFWKLGYGKEFVKAGIQLGFKNLKINRLEAVIDPDNRASIQLAKSVGMMREGIRKKYYYQNKKWADQIVYSAQREIWGFAKLVPK